MNPINQVPWPWWKHVERLAKVTQWVSSTKAEGYILTTSAESVHCQFQCHGFPCQEGTLEWSFGEDGESEKNEWPLALLMELQFPGSPPPPARNDCRTSIRLWWRYLLSLSALSNWSETSRAGLISVPPLPQLWQRFLPIRSTSLRSLLV